MPYINDIWVSDRVREAVRLNDTYTVAAEKAVDAIENYLYNHDHPGYRNLDYLGWSVMQFDATKRGSGHRANEVEWSPESDTEALVMSAPPSSAGMAGQSEAYRLPDHEKARREFDSGPFDTSPADDPTPPAAYDEDDPDAARAADDGFPWPVEKDGDQ